MRKEQAKEIVDSLFDKEGYRRATLITDTNDSVITPPIGNTKKLYLVYQPINKLNIQNEVTDVPISIPLTTQSEIKELVDELNVSGVLFYAHDGNEERKIDMNNALALLDDNVSVIIRKSTNETH